MLLPFFVAENRSLRILCARCAAAILFPCFQFLRWAVHALDPIWVSSAEGRLSGRQHMHTDLPGVRGLPVYAHVRVSLIASVRFSLPLLKFTHMYGIS